MRTLHSLRKGVGGEGGADAGGTGGRGRLEGGAVDMDVVLVHDAHVICEIGCVLPVALFNPSLLVLTGDSRRPLAPAGERTGAVGRSEVLSGFRPVLPALMDRRTFS